VIRAAALALAAALTATGAPAQTVPANWLERPTPAAIQAFYPPAALKQRVHGRVVLTCAISVDGWAQACQVISETPPGYGFGDAAIKVVRVARLSPMTIDGVPVGGGVVQIPINFAISKTWLQKFADTLSGDH
jgi:protein TonB